MATELLDTSLMEIVARRNIGIMGRNWIVMPVVVL